ncbi:MAG TPA: GNAT family N-acetyltransferase [Xanthobacteraceae bacterium]|jgi:GNAT superfamily N-acetyltransferase
MEISEPDIAVKSSLSAPELDDLEALVTEARWNQNAKDWRLFLELGRIYAAHTASGRIVATTATLPYGERFAWVSMVLVAGPYRRRGLATQLMRCATEDLAAAGRVPVLDATPDGQPVYRAIGYQDWWGFHRLRREQMGAKSARDPLAAPAGVAIRPITDDDWPALCAFDAAAFGAARNAVLAGLRGRLRDAELIALSGDRIVGFSLGRDGRMIPHIGPLVAQSDAIACALLAHALARIEAPLFIDLADAKSAVLAFLTARGFAPARPFTRMAHGHARRFDDPQRTFAVVGPEFG